MPSTEPLRALGPSPMRPSARTPRPSINIAPAPAFMGPPAAMSPDANGAALHAAADADDRRSDGSNGTPPPLCVPAHAPGKASQQTAFIHKLYG